MFRLRHYGENDRRCVFYKRVLLSKQTFIATFDSHHVTTTNFFGAAARAVRWASSRKVQGLSAASTPCTYPQKMPFSLSDKAIYCDRVLEVMILSFCCRFNANWARKNPLVQRDYDLQVKLTETAIV